jgi:hypothetical protein
MTTPSMPPRNLATHLLELALVLTLLLGLATLVYGHVGGAEAGLSLTESYITEYMKKAPHWPWLIVSSFTFALLLFLLAAAFLRHGGGGWLLHVGCLMLAATAMGTFFIAYAPVRRVEQPPPPQHEWWTPAWWFTSRTSHTDYEHGMADAYADVHYRATRLVVSFGVAGMAAIGAAGLRRPAWRWFGRVTLALAAAMSVLFLLGDHGSSQHGLWQRSGFAAMYAWLWCAWGVCRSSGKGSPAKDNSR